MWHSRKENLTGEPLHRFESRLHSPPILNGLAQPLILLAGQRHAEGFAPHFARPLIARAAGTRSSILYVTLADPADGAQRAAQALVVGFPLG